MAEMTALPHLVLLAGTSDAIAVATRSLGSTCSFRIASDLDDALSKLTPDVDLILCNVTFDDSQMFDFVRAVRASESLQTVPIICFRQRPLSEAMHHSIELALQGFERTTFVDLHALRGEGGEAAAESALREAVTAELSAQVTREQGGGPLRKPGTP